MFLLLQATLPAHAGFWEDRRAARIRLLSPAPPVQSPRPLPRPALHDRPRSLSECRQAWLRDGYPLEEYLSALLDQVRDPALGAPLRAYVGLARRKNSLDAERIERERDELVRGLSERLGQEALSALVAEALACRLGKKKLGDFYGTLLEEGRRCGLAPGSQLAAYAGILREEASISLKTMAESLKLCEVRAGLK